MSIGDTAFSLWNAGFDACGYPKSLSKAEKETGMTTFEEHQVIYLQPNCKGCNGDEGRLWCQDDQGPCEECGKPWVRYSLTPQRATNHD